MTQTTKEAIRQALQKEIDFAKDNQDRATSAFRHLSKEALAKPYGDSGRSKQAIIDEYNVWVVEAQTALSEFENEV